MIINDAHIRIAVNWWSRFLKEDFTWNNGDDRASNFANENKHIFRRNINELQIHLFEFELFNIIKSELRKSGFLKLSVDYEADGFLKDACEAASIKSTLLIFPCKTSMEIHRHKIEVKQGYGAKWNTINNESIT